MAILTSPASNAAAGAATVATTLKRGRTRDARGTGFKWLLIAALIATLVILVTVLWDMWSDGKNVLTERFGDFVTSGLATNPAAAGIWQGLWGTLWICAIVAIVAFPLGIACAIYLEEYSNESRFARFTRINARNLAGVPSIVYGILGLAVFVKALGGFTGGRSVIAGGLTMSALVLPIVVITSSEALRAVPRGIREGAFAVGATQWEAVRSHVLPAAGPGILTGTVLALARAAGEAAPLLLVGAVTGVLITGGDTTFWDRLTGPFTAMPIVIFSWARQPSDEFRYLTGAASLVLVLLIVILNGLAIWLRNHYEQKW